MKKIALTAAAVVLAALSFTTLTACSDEPDYGGYMEYIKDDAALGQIVMLGAHDAGTAEQSDISRTQNSDFAAMLEGGVRYFDCRVTEVRGELTFVHGDSDGVFAISPQMITLDEAVDDINAFVEQNPSEIVILDFQHTWSATEDAVIAALENGLVSRGRVLTKELASDPSTVTLGQMRGWGKNIVIVYRTAEKCAQNDFLYERSSSLQSDYERSVHNVQPTAYETGSQALIDQFDVYLDTRSGSRLFVLQSQITATGWLEEAEALFRGKANGYLRGLLLPENADRLAALNIVMRDFAVDDDIGSDTPASDTMKAILELNYAKGLISEDRAEEFTSGYGIVTEN